MAAEHCSAAFIYEKDLVERKRCTANLQRVVIFFSLNQKKVVFLHFDLEYILCIIK